MKEIHTNKIEMQFSPDFPEKLDVRWIRLWLVKDGHDNTGHPKITLMGETSYSKEFKDGEVSLPQRIISFLADGSFIRHAIDVNAKASFRFNSDELPLFTTGLTGKLQFIPAKGDEDGS